MMTGGRWLTRLGLLPLLILPLACADPARPENAQIRCCQADPWCPDGYYCAFGLGRCLPDGTKEGEAAILQPFEQDGPVYLRKGEVYTFEMVIDGDLISRPTVVIIDPKNSTYPMQEVQAGSITVANGTKYSFTYAATGEEAEGATVLRINFWDDAGNEVDRAEANLLVFDFTAPKVAGDISVTPASVRPGATIRAEVTFSESVRETPTLNLDSRTGPALERKIASDGGVIHVFEGIAPPTDDRSDHSLVITATDLAGNPSEAHTVTGAFTVDGAPPEIRDLRIKTPDGTPQTTFSAAEEHRDIVLTFDWWDNLDEDDPSRGATLVTIDGKPMDDCQVSPGTGPTFTCRYAVQPEGTDPGADEHGDHSIAIDTQDEAGNRYTYSKPDTRITYDLHAPEVAGATLLREPDFPYSTVNGDADADTDVDTDADAVRLSLGPVDPFSGEPVTVRLIVYSREDLDLTSEPVLTMMPAGQLDFVAVNVETDRVEFEPQSDLTALPDGGEYTFSVTWSDPWGNRQTEPIVDVTLVIDRTGPTTGDVIDLERIVYHRVPWGSKETSGEARVWLEAEANAVDRTQVAALIAYSSDSVDTGLQIGTVLFPDRNTDGHFDDVDLLGGDHAQVYLSPVDASGVRGDPIAVQRVVWTATMGQKVAGRLLENPHVFETRRWFREALVQSGIIEGEDADGIAKPDSDPPLSILGGGSWRLNQFGDSPEFRHRQGMIYDRGRDRTFLFGGRRAWNLLLGDSWEWDGAVWTQLEPTGDLPDARGNFGFAYDLFRGRAVLFGGNAGYRADDTWEWDGMHWIRRHPTDLIPDDRDRTAMAYDSSQRRVVMHGGCLSGYPSCAAFDHSTFEWDGATWVDQTPDNINPGQWPEARAGHAMVYDPEEERILMFGGCTDGTKTQCTALNNETWAWSGASKEWELLNDPGLDAPPLGRHRHAMVFDSHESEILLFAGCLLDADHPTNPVCDQLDGDLWRWSWTTKSWSRIDLDSVPPSRKPSPRQSTSLAFDHARGRVALYGGDDGVTSLPDTWEWTGADWELRGPLASDEPSVRSAFSMAYLPGRDRTVLFGGCFAEPLAPIPTPYNDLWEWDGLVWNEIEASGGGTWPDERCVHATAPSGPDTLLLFGGCRLGAFPICAMSDNQTWEYSTTGSRWENRTRPGGPGARFGHAMAYDGKNDRVFLFGGCLPGADHEYCTHDATDTVLRDNELWIWSNGAWSQVEPPDPPDPTLAWPTPRFMNAMAYDEERDQLVLFGGFGELGCDEGDPQSNECGGTWRWDDDGWQGPEVEFIGNDGLPESRHIHTMTWDPDRQRVVLFGGFADGARNDLWEWDGSSWTLLAASDPEGDGNITPQIGHGLAYDETRKKLVVRESGEERTWEWQHGSGERPGAVLKIYFSKAGAPETRSIESIDVAAVAGGFGFDAGAPEEGLELHAWDEGAWRWKRDAAHGATTLAELVWQVSTPDEIADLFFGPEELLSFAIRPEHPNGARLPAELKVDYVEVTVAYRNGDQ